MRGKTIRPYTVAKFLSLSVALLVFAVTVVTGFIYINNASLVHRNNLENNYQRAMYNISDSVENIEVNLSKLMVSSSDKESYTIISDTLSLSEIAETALSQLPLSRENTVKTSKYFNQVGDWCRAYMKAVLHGGDTDAFETQAEELYIAARNINENIKTIREDMKGMPIYAAIGQGRLLTFDLNTKLFEMNEHTVEYPELIYDGPFSDGKEYTFRALEGLADIDEAAAVEIATRTLSLENVSVTGLAEGKTPTFELIGTRGGEQADVSVTKKGGKIIQYNKNRTVGAATLNETEVGKKAVEFAAGLGYGDLAPVWYGQEEAVAYVNLAPVIDGVVYYTDLVKVKAALDNGEIMGIEATGFCLHFHERKTAPTINEKTAKSLVNKKLTVAGVRLCVIPKDETEHLCYELACEYKGLDYFIYLSAYDGRQVNVLRVVDANQGALVM